MSYAYNPLFSNIPESPNPFAKLADNDKEKPKKRRNKKSKSKKKEESKPLLAEHKEALLEVKKIHQVLREGGPPISCCTKFGNLLYNAARLIIGGGSAFITYYSGANFFSKTLPQIPQLAPYKEELEGMSHFFAWLNVSFNVPINFISSDPRTTWRKIPKIDNFTKGLIFLTWLATTGLGAWPGWQITDDTLQQAGVDNKGEELFLKSANLLIMFFLNIRGSLGVFGRFKSSETESKLSEEARDFRKKYLIHLNDQLPLDEKLSLTELDAFITGKNITLKNQSKSCMFYFTAGIFILFLLLYPYCFFNSAAKKFDYSSFGYTCSSFTVIYRTLLLGNMVYNVLEKISHAFTDKIITSEKNWAAIIFRTLLAIIAFFTITNAAYIVTLYLFAKEPFSEIDNIEDQVILALCLGAFAAFPINFIDADKLLTDIVSGLRSGCCKKDISSNPTEEEYEEIIKELMLEITEKPNVELAPIAREEKAASLRSAHLASSSPIGSLRSVVVDGSSSSSSSSPSSAISYPHRSSPAHPSATTAATATSTSPKLEPKSANDEEAKQALKTRMAKLAAAAKRPA